MKKNTYTVKGPKGVTLIELTVVIAIILLLISILFIGAKFYKDGADRSACIVNINGIQKAVRSVQNLENKKDADATTPDTLAVTDFAGTAETADNSKPLPVIPTCPTGGSEYALAAQYPALGTVVASCTDPTFGAVVAADADADAVAGDLSHAPSNTQGW